MKISNQTLKKLGFEKSGIWWQHKKWQFNFHESNQPTWETIIDRAIKYGQEIGYEEAQSDIRKSLGI